MSDDWVAQHAQRASLPELKRGADGSRTPVGSTGRLSAVLATAWVGFTLYSELGVAAWLQDTVAGSIAHYTGWTFSFLPAALDARLVHLVLAICLAGLVFPLFRMSPRAVVPLYDWVLILIALGAAAYLVAFRSDIETRIGLLLRIDFLAAVAGLFVLCLFLFRTVGGPAAVIAMGFMAFAMLGATSFAPGAVSWDLGATQQAMRGIWLGTSGVFGRPLEIAVDLLFPFVLFGTIWVRACAGTYIASVATSCFGDAPGGSAKAAVTGSLLSGCYAPSATADAGHRGPFTTKLMTHTGVAAGKAATVQSAASSYAQVLPPVMGAAIILIASQSGLPVANIILHALLPGIMAYIVLFCFLHFDARRTGVGGLPVQPATPNRTRNILTLIFWCAATMGLAIAALNGLVWLRREMPDWELNVTAAAWSAIFLAFVWISSRRPDLGEEHPDAPVAEIAPVGAALASGLYLLLPLFFLAVQIAGAHRPPGQAMLLCAAMAALIAVVQHPLKALFRGQYAYMGTAIRRGLKDVFAAIVQAARYMCPVMIASAAAGVVLASAGLAGFDQWLLTAVEQLSNRHVLLGLALAAVAVLLLATGLPTATGYFLAAILVVPAIALNTTVGGLAVPAVATHLFVLYLCVFASHPPPRLAKAALLLVPFLFLANPDLLLIDVAPKQVPVIVITAVLGAVALASALQRYMLVANRMWETAALALIAFTLFNPGFWLDRVQRPFDEVAPARIFATAKALPEDAILNLTVRGPAKGSGDEIKSADIRVLLEDASSGVGRLENAGLTIFLDGDRAILEAPFPDTEFSHLTMVFDFEADARVEVSTIRLPAKNRLARDVFYIPALALFAIIWLLHRRRLRRGFI